MSARLFVEGIEADTLGDIDVDFTFSVADVSDIERRNTSYSKTIILPNTAKNQSLFGNIFDISVNNDYYEEDVNIGVNFNPAKQAKAQIFLDNVKIFDGVLRMSKINSREGDITYEVNMFGRLRDILHELGDKTLGDLDFSDPENDSYDHVWNRTNIEASWNRTEWVDGAQNYVYPLVDYGYSVDSITYPIKNFKPAVFVSEILKRIFKEAKFQVTAPFFNSFYFRKLLLITAEKTITRESTTLLNQTTNLFQQEVTTDPDFTHLLGFTSVETSGFTITNSGTRFTWNKAQPLNTGLNLNFRIFLEALQGYTDNVWTVSVLKNGSEVLYDSVLVPFISAGQIFGWDVEISGGITLALNDYFEIRVTGEIAGSGTNTQLQTEVVIQPGGTFKIGNTVPVAVELEEGDTMKIGYTLPKSMKQRDFLKSIISMYNLYVTQDRLRTNVLEIVPYNEFYRTFKDQALDWSDKLDQSQDITITPLSELSAKEYRLTFDDDSDYWSTSYKTKFNEAYGESRTIIDNDFILDTKTVKVVFSPPVMREQVAGRIMIHLYKVENGVKVPDNFKPRIAYWKPQVDCPSWNIGYGSGNIAYTNYPYAGHLDDPIEPQTDVLFSFPREVYFSIGLYPQNNNLYTEYYEGLITSIGDRNSRLLEGYFYLTPTDISNLDFRTIVKVGVHYFQLEKVDKYNPIANGLSYVSLFKILRNISPVDYDYILLENDAYMLQENGSSRFYI
jgi:hypothetical protein